MAPFLCACSVSILLFSDDMAEDGRPTGVTCKSPLVLCPGSTVCISQSQQCDGKSDCPDGSDEAFCLYMCAKTGNVV